MSQLVCTPTVVERLRCIPQNMDVVSIAAATALEAADTIERLSAENTVLRRERDNLLSNMEVAIEWLTEFGVRFPASGILTEGGDAKQAPGESLSSAASEAGDAQPMSGEDK